VILERIEGEDLERKSEISDCDDTTEIFVIKKKKVGKREGEKLK
jgi:hypothetical protein